MGCFIACFGFKEKKKRRRIPGYSSPSQEQKRRNYVPLDSDVEENRASDSTQFKEKKKEATIEKIRKKVRFNLNVEAYEPIPQNYDDEDDIGMCYCEETGTESDADLHYEEEDVVASNVSNYRYQNCRENYEEEDDELMFSDNDLNVDDDDDQSDDAEDFQSELNDDLMSSVDQLVEGKLNVLDRRQYMCSVLKPVENLGQWKVLKAARPPQYMCEKENLM